MFPLFVAVCEDPVASEYGLESLTVELVDQENPEMRDGRPILAGSGSSATMTSGEYIFIRNFYK